jgi:hypothetical protein
LVGIIKVKAELFYRLNQLVGVSVFEVNQANVRIGEGILNEAQEIAFSVQRGS